MGAYQWQYYIEDLPSPRIVDREQHQRIKDAIEEIQLNAITSIKSEDGTVAVDVVKGEATISKFDIGEAEDSVNVIELASKPKWDGATGLLTYTPVTVRYPIALVEMTAGEDVVIDTAEDCA